MSLAKPPSNLRTIVFMMVLSGICALVLASLASVLKPAQELARSLDRSKQMLIAARIFTNEGYFQVKDSQGKIVPAKHVGNGRLEPADQIIPADEASIIAVVNQRLKAFLVDEAGKETTFQAAQIDEKEYVLKHEKGGYARLPKKLVYHILPNPNLSASASRDEASQVEGYLFHIFGMGLWDAIYGFLALETDGNTVIGISWYDQKETPGLGANIIESPWQSQFPQKCVFQPGASGQTDFQTAPLGIVVVRGKVAEVIGDVPKAKNAVDGMAGATLTGNGVMKGYKDCLEPYRPFLISLQKKAP